MIKCLIESSFSAPRTPEHHEFGSRSDHYQPRTASRLGLGPRARHRHRRRVVAAFPAVYTTIGVNPPWSIAMPSVLV